MRCRRSDCEVPVVSPRRSGREERLAADRQCGGERAKGAVLEGFDRADGSPCDAGHLFDGKVGDKAERDDLPLVGCELEQRVVQPWVERLVGGRSRWLPRGLPAA